MFLFLFRILLKKLALEGESQEREKVLYQFACRYKECNPRFLNGNLGKLYDSLIIIHIYIYIYIFQVLRISKRNWYCI